MKKATNSLSAQLILQLCFYVVDSRKHSFNSRTGMWQTQYSRHELCQCRKGGASITVFLSKHCSAELVQPRFFACGDVSISLIDSGSKACMALPETKFGKACASGAVDAADPFMHTAGSSSSKSLKTDF